MSNRSPKLFIADIKEAIRKAELYIQDVSFNEFKKDDKTIDAVVRNLEIIGELTENSHWRTHIGDQSEKT